MIQDCTKETTVSVKEKEESIQNQEDGQKFLQQINFDQQYSELYKWQQEFVTQYCVNNCNENCLISAGTSAGKTYAVQMLVLKKLIIDRQHVIIALPYVALVDELVQKFKSIIPKNVALIPLNGFKSLPSEIKDIPTLYICTIEKSYQLFRMYSASDQIQNNIKLKNSKQFSSGVFYASSKMDKIGLIVIDEVHYVCDSQAERSCLLENLIINIRTLQKLYDYQLVAMSATIDNIEDFQKLIGGNLIKAESDLRSQKLVQAIYYDKQLFDAKGSYKKLTYFKQFSNNNQLFQLIEYSAKPVLIFCATKKDTEQYAQQYAEFISQKQSLQDSQQKQNLIQRRIALDNTFNNKYMSKCIINGVFYHNSSLSNRERTLIECAYKNKDLDVLFATTTLAAGVNLPTQTVILSSLKTGQQELKAPQYKQMIGRAGRIKSNTTAYSIIYLDKAPNSEMIGTFYKKYRNLSKLNDPEQKPNNILNILFTIQCYNDESDVKNQLGYSKVDTNKNEEIQINKDHLKISEVIQDSLYGIQCQDINIQEYENQVEEFSQTLYKYLNIMQLTNQKDIQMGKYFTCIYQSGMSAAQSTWFINLMNQDFSINLNGSDIVLLYAVSPIKYIKDACIKQFNNFQKEYDIFFEQQEKELKNSLTYQEKNKIIYKLYMKKSFQTILNYPIIDKEIFDPLSVSDLEDNKIFTELETTEDNFVSNCQLQSSTVKFFIIKKAIQIKQLLKFYDLYNIMKDQQNEKLKQNLFNISKEYEQIINDSISYLNAEVRALQSLNNILLSNIIKDILEKLQLFISSDLTELLQIEGIDENKAQKIYDNGYKNAADIVNKGIDQLSAIFQNDRQQALNIYNNAKQSIMQQTF